MTTDSTTRQLQSEPPMVPEAFSVQDAPSANWLVRHIVESRRYADHVRAWAALEIRRAERDEQFFLQRYGGQLEEWVRAEIGARGGNRRSIRLPAGTIGLRRERPHLLIHDTNELLGWCRTNLPDALVVEINAMGVDAAKLRQFQSENCAHARASESLSKSVLERHVRDTGECPNGAEIACGEKFFVK
jgi:hypothetical protein